MFSPDIICQKISLFCQRASRTLPQPLRTSGRSRTAADAHGRRSRIQWGYYGTLAHKGERDFARARHNIRYFENYVREKPGVPIPTSPLT